MKVLLVYPLFPQSFWSFEKALALAGKKSLIPPLGLITVPSEWEFKLVDRNIRSITESEWEWAELVIISGMIVQKEDLLVQIAEAKSRGKRVAVGGPYPTSLPDEIEAVDADYLILNEGEITLPMFVAAIEKGELTGKFTSNEFADVTQTPIPRYELLDLAAYDNMSVQFSRGCPFQCEFCDIIVLYGRKPRTKTTAQLLGELERLYELGWRGNIFMVDDNFIGNKRNVKLLLAELKVWMREKNYPFSFSTEASVDLANDSELIELMLDCNFSKVFIGLETPDADSLTLTKKFQNTREPLIESIEKITEKGMQVMAGFIIGFDNEKPGAGDRIVEFVEQISIPLAMFSMLQALPNTALWHRLEKEKRLIDRGGNINQTTLINFVPTRPIEEIAREYVDSFYYLYEPEIYLDRAFRYFMRIGLPRHSRLKQPGWRNIRALILLLWQQGIVRKTRAQFWHNLLTLVRRNFSLIDHYLTACAQLEHFLEYREVVRDRINTQLRSSIRSSVKNYL
jgi:radical SAM superfamily enzyme YgiQ (UPF0313 family)